MTVISPQMFEQMKRLGWCDELGQIDYKAMGESLDKMPIERIGDVMAEVIKRDADEGRLP